MLVPVGSESLRCYTEREAAEILRCSLDHVRRLRYSGALKHCKIGNRRVVYRHSDLAEFISQGAAA